MAESRTCLVRLASWRAQSALRLARDGGVETNDPAPDRYVENPFGGKNSVVVT